MTGIIALGIGFILLMFLNMIFLITRYKKCPPDKILVVYGKTETGQAAKCIHGGAAFIWPVIQSYAFLDLAPLNIDIKLENAITKDKAKVDLESIFTVGISDEEGIMNIAADRLLGLSTEEIRTLAYNLIESQMNLIIAMMDAEELDGNKDKLNVNIHNNIEQELKKVGLKLINLNLRKIQVQTENVL